MNKFYLTILIFIFFGALVYGQGKDEFKPEVKIGGTVYSG